MIKGTQVPVHTFSQGDHQNKAGSDTSHDRPLVLVIDDEPAIGESLTYSLQGAGFSSITAMSLGEADTLLQEHGTHISLVILDLSLPDGHGFDWLRSLRTSSSLPVIILSSHDDEIEHIVGLEIGADDFIDKPFSPREVVARARAILRRIHRPNPTTISDHLSPIEKTQEKAQEKALEKNNHQREKRASEIADEELIIIDYSQYKVFVEGDSLGLSQLEFSLFETLHLERRVHTRAQLLHKAWRGGVSVSERTVDVHITGLRKKWAEYRREELIETIRGVGYRLAEDIPKVMTRGQPIK